MGGSLTTTPIIGSGSSVRDAHKAGAPLVSYDFTYGELWIAIPVPRTRWQPCEQAVLEKHWNGAKLTDTRTMLEWAKSMTWKGVHPVVELSRTAYEKGVTVAKEAMQAVQSRLERHPLLPKWDI